MKYTTVLNIFDCIPKNKHAACWRSEKDRQMDWQTKVSPMLRKVDIFLTDLKLKIHFSAYSNFLQDTTTPKILPLLLHIQHISMYYFVLQTNNYYNISTASHISLAISHLKFSTVCTSSFQILQPNDS